MQAKRNRNMAVWAAITRHVRDGVSTSVYNGEALTRKRLDVGAIRKPDIFADALGWAAEELFAIRAEYMSAKAAVSEAHRSSEVHCSEHSLLAHDGVTLRLRTTALLRHIRHCYPTSVRWPSYSSGLRSSNGTSSPTTPVS